MIDLNELYRGTVQADRDGKHRGTGLGAFILKPFVDEQSIESQSQQQDVKRTLVAAGEDPNDYNLGANATAVDAQGAIVSTRREREKADKEKDKDTQIEILRESQAPGLEASRATNARLLQQGNQQMQLGLAQIAQSQNQFNAQMADNKDQRAMELQVRREELDRADARDERNRRRESIAALTSGLAALGAAFAL